MKDDPFQAPSQLSGKIDPDYNSLIGFLLMIFISGLALGAGAVTIFLLVWGKK